ncbi:MAG TPA: TolC family protein [Phycisphaerae bacterium]|nr:TolC family protein [Phycisphaerae bacterium]
MSADQVEPAPELTQMGGPTPVELTGKVPATQPAVDTTIWLQLPDPIHAEEVFKKRLEITRLSDSIKREYERIYRDALAYIKQIERPKVFTISLGDALRRMLAHNYAIKIEGYAPAISTAQIVQAEAAFDMAFFANASRNNTDQPQPFLIRTPLQQRGFENDTTIVNGGIRKLLATGATATLTQQMTRLDNPSSKYTNFYPTWSQNFIAELRQPVLRNFGIDFNRAQINIRKNEREANREAFRARVIETLNNTERAYWELVGARRDVTISAELLAEAILTLSQVQARIDFDAYQTLLYRSQAAVKAREFEYIDVKNRVRNAEDQLLNLLNDPDLPLSADYEIIPIDNPTTVSILRDRFQAVQTALEHRPEILRARYIVDTTRIQLGVAKNQALPRLDAVYRMTLNGVGGNADQGFDEMTTGNFVDQFVGVEFAWNFGERAERAGIRIAKLQQSQAVVAYKKALDDIITDCRVALRNLETNLEQIPPSHEAVTSNSENLRSLQERQERKSPAELDVILNAQLNLAVSRRALLQAVVAYNQGIVDVERAKGTLLEYDNVILAEEP